MLSALLPRRGGKTDTIRSFDHLHAVWPRLVQNERQDDDRNASSTRSLPATRNFAWRRSSPRSRFRTSTPHSSNDASRNEMIAADIVSAIETGRCPLLLTGRTEHLQYFAAKLAGVAKHVFVLKGGMEKKQRREMSAALADQTRVRSAHPHSYRIQQGRLETMNATTEITNSVYAKLPVEISSPANSDGDRARASHRDAARTG